MRADDMAGAIDALRPKNKSPRNRSVLDSWIAHAEAQIDPQTRGRLIWLIATTVASAVLQRVIDVQGNTRFLLKGGSMLQHRLGLIARSTKDLDGIVRGDLDDFIDHLDEQLSEPWGPIDIHRTEIEVIRTPARIVKPRRFELVLSIRGETWRRVKVEISSDEGKAGVACESFTPIALDRFGLPTSDKLSSISLGYQIAQKVHAATDPHNPPNYVNNRPRDVVDLLLLKGLCDAGNGPSDNEVLSAINDIFDSRADEALLLGRIPRRWPARVTAYPHWQSDFDEAAAQCGLKLRMEDAIAEVNEWLDGMDGIGNS